MYLNFPVFLAGLSYFSQRQLWLQTVQNLSSGCSSLVLQAALPGKNCQAMYSPLWNTFPRLSSSQNNNLLTFRLSESPTVSTWCCENIICHLSRKSILGLCSLFDGNGGVRGFTGLQTVTKTEAGFGPRCSVMENAADANTPCSAAHWLPLLFFLIEQLACYEFICICFLRIIHRSSDRSKYLPAKSNIRK